MKTIKQRYFNELLSVGHTVPRQGGSLDRFQPFTVGKEYQVRGDEVETDILRVRCTQDCPYHLVVVNNKN